MGAPKLIYTPEGREDDPYVWTFEPFKLLSPEAEAVEAAAKQSFVQCIILAQSGHMKALRAFVWVYLKRTIHDLKFDDVVFSFDEIDFQAAEDDDEAEVDEAPKAGA